MAKPLSLARGMSSVSASGSSADSTASLPSGAQVMLRNLTFFTNFLATCTAARDSGLLPERAKETSSVGSSGFRKSRGAETMSVVAMGLKS